MSVNYKQLFAIQRANEERIKKVCPDADNSSGIYLFWREEDGVKFGYIGLAHHIIKRLGQHLSGYKQHIDLSLRKHKLYSEDNPTGYHVEIIEKCPEDKLDEREKFWIQYYVEQGYTMVNVSGGGQGENRIEDLNERKPAKKYKDGVAQGQKNILKTIAKLFEKNLTYAMTEPENKNKKKSYDKFTELLNEAREQDVNKK